MKKYLLISLVVVILWIMISQKLNAQTDQTNLQTFKVAQSTVNKVNTYDAIVRAASQQHGIPVSRIKAHIAVESGGDVNAVGSSGERGLMQVKSGALTDVNKRFSPDAPFKLSELYEASPAIFVGTAYLHILLLQLGSLDKASVAYKTGAGDTDNPNGKVYLSKILIAEKLF